MITVATSLMGWSESSFWTSTPRKYTAMKNQFMETENQKLKLVLQAINPHIEFSDGEEERGVYADQVFF